MKAPNIIRISYTLVCGSSLRMLFLSRAMFRGRKNTESGERAKHYDRFVSCRQSDPTLGGGVLAQTPPKLPAPVILQSDLVIIVDGSGPRQLCIVSINPSPIHQFISSAQSSSDNTINFCLDSLASDSPFIFLSN